MAVKSGKLRLETFAMKKILIMTLIVNLCFNFIGCGDPTTNIPIELTKTISGKILFRDPLVEGMNKPNQGLVLLDSQSTAITPIGIFGGNARFMGNTSKILVDTGLGEIELYDIDTKNTIQVYQAETPYISSIDISYVDEKHFSVTEENKMFLVNIQDNSKKKIVEEKNSIGTHSWCNNGKNVYYSAYTVAENNQVLNQIFKLNVETGQREYLYDGIYPKVSKDGRLIAYFPNGDRTKLIIKELNGKGQWEYTAPMVKFCFSPDGEYIASVERWRGPWYYEGYTVKIVDYKTGNAQTVVPKYANGQCYDIDWAE